MKTLHVTNSWHANSGGIATFYRALMDAASRRQHEIRLVVPGAEDKVEDIAPHVRIYSVACRPAPLNPEYRMMFPNLYLRRGARLREILNEERPDLVEVCDKYTLNYFGGMLRTGMLGDVKVRPLVVGLSCERMDDSVRAYVGWNAPARLLARFYMKWLYFSLFDHHIVNSDYTAGELRLVSAGHPIRRGVWIRPMGVDFRELSPDHRSSVARYGLLKRVQAGSEAVLLLYVGRLAPEKNLGLLLDTLEKLQSDRSRDWRLILVGDGPLRSSFLACAELRTPGRVSWLGHIRDRRELAGIYANCDLFVHPNPREPFGIAPLEAMASGLPLVAPDCGGVTSFADSTNAWTLPPEGEAFANAVREVMSLDELRETRVAQALQTASQFRWEEISRSFLDLYEDLWRTHLGAPCRLGADFYSTAPPGEKAPVARFIARAVQRLLATPSISAEQHQDLGIPNSGNRS